MTDTRPLELAPEVRRSRMRGDLRLLIESVAVGLLAASLATLGAVATLSLCGAV